MGKFWKISAVGVLVLVMGIALFFETKSDKTIKNPMMIEAKWNYVGYDRDGNRLLPNGDIESASRFEISFDSTSNLAYVSNPIDGTVMRFDENGQYFFSQSVPSVFAWPDKPECKPVSFGKVNGYIKKNTFTNCTYVTDTSAGNVFRIEDSYRLANPAEAVLFEPVQTAVFESSTDWREYVIDKAGNKLMCFSPKNLGTECARYSTLLWSVPKDSGKIVAPEGESNYSFSSPSGLCVDGAGNVYVADTGNDRIMKYNIQGEFQDVFQSELNKPRAVTVSTDGTNIFVCDTNNKRIVAIDSKTKQTILSITDKRFASPDAICLDSQGSIWVGDSASNMLFKFAGLETKQPGALVFAVNDVLTSKKYPKTVCQIELMKYSCTRNEQKVKIRPYAQSRNKIPCVPIRFVFENLIKDESRGNLEGFSYEFDSNAKSLTIIIPQIQTGQDSVLEQSTVRISVGSDKATVNGKEVSLSGKVLIIDNSVFVPFADLEKLFDIGVTVKEPKTEPVSKNAVFTLVFPSTK